MTDFRTRLLVKDTSKASDILRSLVLRDYEGIPQPIGDITQKGYEKKRARLLAPYIPASQTQVPFLESTSPSSRAYRRNHRRATRDEKRYHSEVRQEAVQQALAAMKDRGKPSVPMPSKRTSVMATSPQKERHESDSSSDEDSLLNEGSQSTPERERLSRPYSHGPGQSDSSSTSSARDTPPQQRHRHYNGGGGGDRSREAITNLADVMQNLRPSPTGSQPPDVTSNTTTLRRAAADRVNRYNQSHVGSVRVTQHNAVGIEDTMGTGKWKVSAKIQQLLNTLKRPKRKPLPEFYVDDDAELERELKTAIGITPY